MLLLHFASLLGRYCHHAVFHKIVVSITMGFPLLGVIFSLTGVSLALSPSSFLLFLRLEPVSLSLLSASIVLETLSSQRDVSFWIKCCLQHFLLQLWLNCGGFAPCRVQPVQCHPPLFEFDLTFRVRPSHFEFDPFFQPSSPRQCIQFDHLF